MAAILATIWNVVRAYKWWTCFYDSDYAYN
jgi:hypothetical protein